SCPWSDTRCLLPGRRLRLLTQKRSSLMRIQIEIVDQIYPERFYSVPDLRACQRVELDRGLALVAVERFVIGVNGRMKIYLAGFRREVVERIKKISLAHSAALKIAVYPLGKSESA